MSYADWTEFFTSLPLRIDFIVAFAVCILLKRFLNKEARANRNQQEEEACEEMANPSEEETPPIADMPFRSSIAFVAPDSNQPSGMMDVVPSSRIASREGLPFNQLTALKTGT